MELLPALPKSLIPRPLTVQEPPFFRLPPLPLRALRAAPQRQHRRRQLQAQPCDDQAGSAAHTYCSACSAYSACMQREDSACIRSACSALHKQCACRSGDRAGATPTNILLGPPDCPAAPTHPGPLTTAARAHCSGPPMAQAAQAGALRTSLAACYPHYAARALPSCLREKGPSRRDCAMSEPSTESPMLRVRSLVLTYCYYWSGRS